MDFLYQLTHNYILNAAVFSWGCAQLIKFFLTLVNSGKISTERLLGPGGMPSSHSSMVTALTLSVARQEGVYSAMFAISLMFACVVMFDAMGVRRAAGDHAKAINKMRDSLDLDEEDEEERELKEVLGHKPIEVLGGVLLGILIALLVPH